MKKLIFIVLLLCSGTGLMAQDSPLLKFYKEYASDPAFETTEIMPGSMSFEWQKEMDNRQVSELMAEIKDIRILRYQGKGKMSMDKFLKNLEKTASDDRYAEVLNARSDGDFVRLLYLREPSGDMKEIALIASDEEGVMLLTMTGTMNFQKMLSPDMMEGVRQMGDYYIKGKGGCEVK